MKCKYLFYPLVLLACIQLGAVVGALQNKRTFVDIERTSNHRQAKGRHRSDAVPLVEGDLKTKNKPHTKKEATNKKSDDDIHSTQAPPPKGPESEKPDIVNGTKPGKGGDSGGTGTENYHIKMVDMMDMKTVFLILLGVTSLLIGCFVFKLIRSRSRRKTKKYGILATHGSEVELTPLEQDDEDEDMTVFDANSK